MTIRQLCAMFGTILLAAGAPSIARATAIIDVTLDTSALLTAPGSLSGPFSVFVQLTNGSHSSGENTVTLSDFAFGGGGPTPGTTVSGGATGDLGTEVTLTDSRFFNSFRQEFTAGNLLSFRIIMTTNVAGRIADTFAFSLLDATGFAIATLDPSLADTFLTISIDSESPAIATYGSDLTRTGISIAAPQVSSVATVPEPGTLMLIGIGMMGLIGRCRRARLSA